VLRQFFGQAEAHAQPVAEPDQRGGQQAPDRRIKAKPKMIGSHSLAGSISALSSSLARSNSSDQRVSGLSAPENCFPSLAASRRSGPARLVR
jgi:hypothetical protein